MDEFNPPVRECISVREAAQYAGCSRANIHHALQRGRLKGIKHGGHWWTTKAAVDEYFQSRWIGWLNEHQRQERAAKIRADWTCQRCGKRRNEPGIRAIMIYYRDRDQQNQSPENMIVLCYFCWLLAMETYHPAQLSLPGMELPEWIR